MRNINFPRSLRRRAYRAGGLAGRLLFGFPLSTIFLAAFPSIVFLSCATVSLVDGRPLAVAALPGDVRPLWRPFPGDDAGMTDGCLAYFAGRVSQPRLEFHALRICIASPALRVVAAGGKRGDGSDEILSTRVSSFVRDNGLLAGINALPFSPVSGREGEPRANVGIVVSDGRLISPPAPQFDALVLFEDGSAAIKSQSDISCAEGIASAVGGFRRVLEGYELAPRVLGLQARHPRSAAGISSCGRFLYLLAIDGRRRGSIGATEAEIALLLRALGAAEGINFDGGGSTSLALRFPDGRIRVVNTPIHRQIPGRERAVAGVLGIERRACGQ